MDPTGPWSYAYNRLAVAGATASAASSTSEFQQNNLLATTTAGSSNTAAAQLFLQAQGGLTSPYNSSGFISPPSHSTTYESVVFPPLFQHINPKPAHSTVKSETESPTYASFYNQNATTASPTAATIAWHQNNNQISPFGILPHESGGGSEAGATEASHFTNSTFAIQHSTNQLSGIKNASNSRAVSPQVKQQQHTTNNSNTNSYYRQPSFADSAAQTVNKPTNPTCIVIASQAAASPNTTKDSTSTVTVVSKANTMYSGNLSRGNDKIRTTANATTAAATNLVNHTINSGFGVPLMPNKVNQNVQIQQQTKAQTKTYPQFLVVEETDRKPTESTQSEQEQVSYYTIIDGRFAYAATPGGATNLQTPRHILLTNSADLDTTRIKVENQYSTNQNECSNTIIVPRRPSPAQSNSSQVPSPAYPIYNSPMNSIESPSQHSTGSSHPSDSTGNIVIYKTNQQQNQVTPQTPLDASISRNANSLTNSSPVAYSSVITRALDPIKLAEQTYQTCWGNTNDAKQKLVGINAKQQFYNNNAHIGALSNVHKSENHVAENILVTTDRPLATQIQMKMNNQQSPVAAAANITIPNVVVQPQQQQQQQQPQPAPPATKGRRRKNANTSKTREQLLSENEFLVNREPPPAHCAKTPESVINQQQQQQEQHQHSMHQLQHQQNGATPYFDLARWNIPAKINPAMPILPNQMNYGSHHHQQQQHHHQPPIITPQPHVAPMSYYPGFAMHADIQSAAVHNQNLNMGGGHGEKPEPIKDITPIATQEPVAEEQPPIEEEPKPKVIVPNIEEELDFLSTDKPPKKPSNQVKKHTPAVPPPKQPEPAKPVASTRNGIGFMESYLKFLNGERDTSPPPTPRTGRRNWQKPIITSVQVVPNPTTQTNRTDQSEPSPSTTLTSAQQSSVQSDDSQSEIKKTKSRKKKLSDNEPDTSPHEQQQYQQPQQSIYRSPLPKKARPQMAMQMPSMYNDASSIFNNSNVLQSTTTGLQGHAQQHNAMSNASSNAAAASNHLMQPQFLPGSSQVVTTPTPYQYHQIQEDPLVVPQRRVTSTRKAKARGIAEIISKTSDNEEEPAEFADSDTDPVWTPQDEYDDEPKSSSKRKQRNPKSMMRFKHSNILTDESDSESTGDDSDDAASKKNKQRPANRTISAKFSTGDFVILNSEQHQKCPSLWEIDSKTILKKYEPFMESNKLFYKSKTMFTTWRNNTMDLYMRVTVRKCFQNSNEKIVELIRPQQQQSSSQTDDSEFVEKLMIKYLDYKDRFEVYVQTLISQALDSSFFIEIMREQDAYFLPNITAIDTIIDACHEKLSIAIKWPERITVAIKTWPNYRIIREMEMNKYRCATCNQVAGITFSLSGPAYSSKTLLAAVPDSVVALYDKNITMCHSCVKKAEALHKITHEKYNLFAICSKRVQDLSIDNEKGSTEILKELLADSNWINELFKVVRTHWIEAHKIERTLSMRNNLTE